MNEVIKKKTFRVALMLRTSRDPIDTEAGKCHVCNIFSKEIAMEEIPDAECFLPTRDKEQIMPFVVWKHSPSTFINNLPGLAKEADFLCVSPCTSKGERADKFIIADLVQDFGGWVMDGDYHLQL